MKDQAVKQRDREALLSIGKDILYNPAVEFIGGLLIIDLLFKPDPSAVGTKTTTIKTTPSFWGNPFWIFKQMAGTNTTIETIIEETEYSSQEEWAKQALLWIILAQQLAPAAPTIVEAAGNVAGGLLGSVGGLLKLGSGGK